MSMLDVLRVPANDLFPASNPSRGTVRKDEGVEYAARLPGLRPGAEAATMPRVSERVSDGDLIQRVGGGDRNAFEALYRRFARPVFGLALRAPRAELREPVGRELADHRDGLEPVGIERQ